jgi:hypothetical protein
MKNPEFISGFLLSMIWIVAPNAVWSPGTPARWVRHGSREAPLKVVI